MDDIEAIKPLEGRYCRTPEIEKVDGRWRITRSVLTRLRMDLTSGATP